MLQFNLRTSLRAVAALTGLVWAVAGPTVAAERGELTPDPKWATFSLPTPHRASYQLAGANEQDHNEVSP